jgi:hypothetical protein
MGKKKGRKTKVFVKKIHPGAFMLKCLSKLIQNWEIVFKKIFWQPCVITYTSKEAIEKILFWLRKRHLIKLIYFPNILLIAWRWQICVFLNPICVTEQLLNMQWVLWNFVNLSWAFNCVCILFFPQSSIHWFKNVCCRPIGSQNWR